ncbi:MAG: glycogen synthase GlgA [Thiohalophilus sp.]|jgi:starch synthase
MSTYRVLYCSSEAYPLIKTGGLGDVAGSLPRALQQLGHDVRLVLPAYREVMQSLPHRPRLCVETRVGIYPVRIWQTTLPGTRVTTWLVDCEPLYDRPGNPYLDADGDPWPDNARRFALFCEVVALMARDQFGMDWQPGIVHCNDWQTGLVPVLLEDPPGPRPATVFTIHNLAYQGIFDRATFEHLNLPEPMWHYERLEYHGQFAFIKGGLVYADRLNTVSPGYAKEIQTAMFGHGMEGLLSHRSDRVSGILNGIDTRTWNPGTDPLITQRYNWQHLDDKLPNKLALQQHFGLPQQEEALLFGMVSRLVEQKGIDLVLESLSLLFKLPLQLVILGSGAKRYEQALHKAADQYSQQLGVEIGYDEQLAHAIEAGSDLFLMPSRFEPCGLNQMYSQRYGSLPLVTPVGGLADTVVDANQDNLQQGAASGFVMAGINRAALQGAVQRALLLYQQPDSWRQLQKAAMKKDFSWAKSASSYTQLYAQALRDKSHAPI